MTTNSEWWKSAVIYQIYPRSFLDTNNDGIGDLNGITQKLDYLNDGTPASLGVNALWINPFYLCPQYDFGYDVQDYRKVDPQYGTMEDFDRLLAEAHKRAVAQSASQPCDDKRESSGIRPRLAPQFLQETHLDPETECSSPDRNSCF